MTWVENDQTSPWTDFSCVASCRRSVVAIVIWLTCRSPASSASVSSPCSRRSCPRRLWTHLQVGILFLFSGGEFTVVGFTADFLLIYQTTWRRGSAWGRRKWGTRSAERSELKLRRTRSRVNVSTDDQVTAGNINLLTPEWRHAEVSHCPHRSGGAYWIREPSAFPSVRVSTLQQQLPDSAWLHLCSPFTPQQQSNLWWAQRPPLQEV